MSERINLKAERLNRGWSAAQAAKRMGIGKNVLLNAESGVSVPRPETAFKIAKEYGYTVTEVWPVDEKAAA